MSHSEQLLDHLSHLRADGVFSSADADRAGVHPTVLARWNRDGSITRLLRGWYVSQGSRSRRDWHLCVLTALQAQYGSDIVASHHTALHVHDLAVFGCPPAVHVTRRGSGSWRRHDRYVIHLTDAGARAATGEAVPVEHAVVQTGLLAGPLAALVAGDDALRSRRTTVEEILDAARGYHRAPGMRALRPALDQLDPRCESVGESLLRYALWQLDLPHSSQYVPAGTGRRCDLALTGTPLIVEFDGMGKFGGSTLPATAAGARALIREGVTGVFERDETLTNAGVTVLHVTWSQLIGEGGRLEYAALDRRIRARLRAIEAQRRPAPLAASSPVAPPSAGSLHSPTVGQRGQ